MSPLSEFRCNLGNGFFWILWVLNPSELKLLETQGSECSGNSSEPAWPMGTLICCAALFRGPARGVQQPPVHPAPHTLGARCQGKLLILLQLCDPQLASPGGP